MNCECWKKIAEELSSYIHGDDKNERFGVRQGLHGMNANFAIIGLRCDDESCTGKKVLKVGQIYKFLEGYIIEDTCIKIERWRDAQNLLYDDYSTENSNQIPHVNFSAIVGKNGYGKSSIIELMMRVINNFAVQVLGELNSDPAAEKLRYVEGVCATLWFMMGEHVYRLTIDKQRAKMVIYEKEHVDSEDVVYLQKYTKEYNVDGKCMQVVHGFVGEEELIHKELSQLFYTFVSNYSIYAYNTHDFAAEAICKEKKELIGGFGEEDGDDVWLFSLFHKNDGYKVPIGISPYRYSGNINVNSERELSKERLVSLMVRNEKYRLINWHMIAEGVKIKKISVNDYGYEYVKSKLKFSRLSPEGYTMLRKMILQCWKSCIDMDFMANVQKAYYKIALNYIVYKTLKVSMQYDEHHEFYSLFDMADNFPSDMVEKMVDGQSKDLSHITRKIFQTISYLMYDVYDLSSDDAEYEFLYNSFDDILQRWGAKERRSMAKTSSPLQIYVWNSALFPPPFCKYDIKMHATNNDEEIMMEAWSSGERQQLFTISSILYHLDNLNSIKDDQFDANRVFYPHVHIVLEEIELYFHPEMQQSFVRYLLDGIHAINLEHLKSIHFTLVTHSPYVLSDIPRTNILVLKDIGVPAEYKSLKTFGANIHDMLSTNFFLSAGAIGSYAQWEIKHLAACLRIHQWAKNADGDYSNYAEVKDGEAFDFMERYMIVNKNHKKFFEYDWFNEELGAHHLKERIDLIDEPVLRNALMRSYCSTFDVPSMEKEERRRELIRQLQELDSK